VKNNVCRAEPETSSIGKTMKLPKGSTFRVLGGRILTLFAFGDSTTVQEMPENPSEFKMS